MNDMGRALLVIGAVLAVAGGALILAERMGWPRLPGDIVIRRDNVAIYVPIATSIVFSLLLTIVFQFLSGRR